MATTGAVLQRHQASNTSQSAAREFKGDKGFHFTRRTIALLVVIVPVFRKAEPGHVVALLLGTAITLPILLPAFIRDITIVIGYYDTVHGFWPWSSTYETINWIAIGSGLCSSIVINSVINNILIPLPTNRDSSAIRSQSDN